MASGDQRPSRLAATQRRLVRDCVGHEVLAFATTWREHASVAAMRHPGSPADLRVFEPRPLGALGPAEGLIVRPTRAAAARSGPRPVRRRLRWARLTGRGRSAGARILDPLYKPIAWVIDGGIPVGSTEVDLERLASLGATWLHGAGIGGADAIVSVLDPTPSTALLQLLLGARRLRIPLAAPGPRADPAEVARLGPSVLVGRAADLVAVARGLGDGRTGVHTALVVGERAAPGALAAVRRALPSAAVLEAWAPPVVRSLWFQCRSGDGLHTSPETELVELLDGDGRPVPPGETGRVVWTGLGWRGTVVVRLDTRVRASLDANRCPACGSAAPRLHLAPVAGAPAAATPVPADAAAPVPVDATAPVRVGDLGPPHSADEAEPWPAPVLDRTDGVAGWQAVLRDRDGRDELLVYLALDDDADLGAVLSDLERAVGADQYVVVDEARVAERVEEAGGRRVVVLAGSPA